MHLVRQDFDSVELDDLEGHLAAGLNRQLERAALPPGASVAIAVGSRGVSPVVEVVRTLARGLREAGLRPFVVPAMGSHGGGTAEGQASVLADYGVHEGSVGAPVRATMDTIEVGKTSSGITVHLDAEAAGADGVIVIGRVKPHTGFRGPIESGLCKMSVIGLGNRRGAESLHAHPLATGIPEAAALTVASGHLLCGVALVENAFDRPARAEVVPPEAFHATDEALPQAGPRTHAPPPPRQARRSAHRPHGPRTSRVPVWIRTSSACGAAWESWSAHPTTDGWRCLASRPSLTATPSVSDWLISAAASWPTPSTTKPLAMNTLTAMALHAAKVPLTLPTDRACYETVLHLAARSTSEPIRIGRIRNTLDLETFWVSESVLGDLPGTCQVIEPTTPFSFDADDAIVETCAFEPRA